jgi:hypothetical protein
MIGLKKYMTLDGSTNSLKYLKHKPGFKIKENSIKYWVEDEKEFKGWELYVPDKYIAKIKKQKLRKDVDDREYINFDSHYLLSLFNSLNPDLYKKKLR